MSSSRSGLETKQTVALQRIYTLHFTQTALHTDIHFTLFTLYTNSGFSTDLHFYSSVCSSFCQSDEDYDEVRGNESLTHVHWIDYTDTCMYTCNTCSDTFKNNILLLVSLIQDPRLTWKQVGWGTWLVSLDSVMVMMVGCSVCLCATIQIYIHMYTCNTCTDTFKNNILVIVSLLASVMVMMVGRSVRLCVRWTNHCVSLPLDSPLNRMSSHLSKKMPKKRELIIAKSRWVMLGQQMLGCQHMQIWVNGG